MTDKISARRWTFRIVVPTLALFLPLASCEKPKGSDGHDRGARSSEDRHDADHGHTTDEEHVDEVRLTDDAVERYQVKVGEARLWILKPTFVAPARVGFNTEAMAHVGSPLRGRVVEIKVRLGESVMKGDPLLIVESPELGQSQAEYLLKRTAAQSASPQVDLAKAAWDRAKGLLDQSQGISLTEVQKREAEYKAAVASLKFAEATAAAAENALHLLGMDHSAIATLASTGEISPQYTIRASMKGQVVQREVTLGELVNPDRDALMILADTTVLWVLADVPESRLASIAPGGKAWVSLGSGTAYTHEGEVAFVAPLVDPTTRSAQVRIEMPSSVLGNGGVKPGMFARVEIAVAVPGGAEPLPQVAVPQEAVQTVEGEPAVFVPVFGEGRVFQKRALSVGPAVGGLVPVFSGLVEGEKYIESGSFILKAELGKGSAAHAH